MTEKAVLQTPHVETVILGISVTIERDYIQRGVFPALRNQNAVSWSGSTGFHHLTIDEAEALLEDARACRESAVNGGTTNAYSSHVRALENTIKEARTRKATLEAKEPVCERKSEYSEHWHGTKEQLLAIGICLDGPWPGEPGGKLRWAKTTDKRGYPASLSRYSATWGTYRVRIEIPQEERRGKEDEEQRAKKRDEAQRSLDHMPYSADSFRRDIAKSVRRLLQIGVEPLPTKWHGYAFDDESLTAILVSGDAVVESIMAAKVNFDAKRHQEIALGYKKAIAEADNAFQDKLSLLTKPNAKILEGASS